MAAVGGSVRTSSRNRARMAAQTAAAAGTVDGTPGYNAAAAELHRDAPPAEEDDGEVVASEPGQPDQQVEGAAAATSEFTGREASLEPDGAHGDPHERPLRQSRVYADVNLSYPRSRFDIEGHRLTWGSFKNYKIHEMVGHGAYGEVFRAVNTRTKQVCVIKQIRPEKEEKIKIQREVKMLQLMQGGPNIVKLIELTKDPKTKDKMIVFEYVENPDFRDVFLSMTQLDAQVYLYGILKALKHAHSSGVIHRDLKPRNVLYNPATHQIRLIDWGFGEFYFPKKPIPKWPGTRYYKAPELFLHYEFYDYSVDMWAFGCMVGSIILRRIPMFCGKLDSMSQMQAIAKVLGSEGLFVYMSKYKMPLRYKYRKGIKKRRAMPWDSFVNAKNAALATPEALDLLDKILVWDHEKRLTVVEAMQHPYFAQVRNMEPQMSASSMEEQGEYSMYNSDSGGQGDISSYSSRSSLRDRESSGHRSPTD